jgi:nucleotide-binding universal stress UspA family protein
MFRSILAPLDGSAFAEQALSAAGEIARRTGASVRLVRVHVPIGYGDLALMDRWEKEHRRSERDYLARTAAWFAERFGAQVLTSLLEDPIAPAICQCARDSGADLVVMSTHGRTGVSRAWLGSVADAVARQSTIPVLMTRPESRMRGSAPHADDVIPLQHAMVPLDGSQLAEGIVDHALQLATTFGSSVTLLRVVEPVQVIAADYPLPYPIPLGMIDPKATDRLVSEAHEYLTMVAARLHERYGLDVSVQVRVSDRVAPAILEAADERGVDLVAMASHGRGASRLLVGSVADKVLRGAPRAVLLFHPPQD